MVRSGSRATGLCVLLVGLQVATDKCQVHSNKSFVSRVRHELLFVCCRRLSSSDIKDKTELLKGRKDIEREMERFKVPYNLGRVSNVLPYRA
jgi:hypothetical protein